MTQDEKLKKIYDIANDRGWDDKVYVVAMSYLIEGKQRVFLFDQTLAKAIWGEGKQDGRKNKSKCPCVWHKFRKWEHNLQLAVISDNPIDYYIDNL